MNLIEGEKLYKKPKVIAEIGCNHTGDIKIAFELIDLAKDQWNLPAIAGSELDVLSRLIDAGNQFKADIVIRVTGDNPFTDGKIIDKIVYHHIKTEADYTRMIGLPIGVTADIMSTSMLNPLYKLIPDPNQSEYLQLFAIDPDHFQCELINAPPKLNRPFYSLTVDYVR